MRLEHHLVGGYVRYISPHIIIIIIIVNNDCFIELVLTQNIASQIYMLSKVLLRTCQRQYTLRDNLAGNLFLLSINVLGSAYLCAKHLYEIAPLPRCLLPCVLSTAYRRW